jgi:hypothetical protein
MLIVTRDGTKQTETVAPLLKVIATNWASYGQWTELGGKLRDA